MRPVTLGDASAGCCSRPRPHTHVGDIRETRHQASPVTPQMAEGVILDLANRLRRLSPSSRDPEHFHEEKSEIVHALHLIAREVGR